MQAGEMTLDNSLPIITSPNAGITPGGANTDLDATLAKELNQMSVAEREVVYEEVHGVDKIVDETSEMLAKSLDALDFELGHIRHKPAFDKACQICHNYVDNRQFRLQFLRSTSFNAKEAAEKIVKYMEGKLEFFGLEGLARPLYLSDLDPDDEATLKSGVIQILSERDRTGRAVVCDFQMITRRCYKNPINLIRVLFYMLSAAVEDEETQRRGFVSLVYSVGPIVGEFNAECYQGTSRVLDLLPVRVTCIHICFHAPRLRPLLNLAMSFMGRELRVRLRIHEHNHMETQYSLMTFGIPVDVLPVNNQGEVKKSYQSKWVERRRIRDLSIQEIGYFHGIDLPGRYDVVLRRGKKFHDHPGNFRMRLLVESNQEAYKLAPVGEKAPISDKIVQEIKSESGRFLELDPDGWWVEVSNKEASKRVSKSIRSARSTKAVQRKQKMVQESAKRMRMDEGGDMQCFGISCLRGG